MTVEATRLLLACGVVGVYTALCGVHFLRHGARRRRLDAALREAPADGVLVVYASQTGQAELLATKTANQLRAAAVPVTLASVEQVDASSLQAATRALFVVSTTGEGDAPDAAAGFCRRVMPEVTSLHGLRYGVLALGDRSYRDYCAFGYTVDHWLRERQAMPLFDLVDVDNGNEAACARWGDRVGASFGSGADVTQSWIAEPFGTWRLVDRQLLNAGSPGGPVFHVVLQPLESDHLQWLPGDIAEIAVPAGEGRPAAVTRQYSIASLPCEGRLELLVRQVRHEDGRLGVGSGWLTAHASRTDEISLRVRVNRTFHPPAPERPLVLIGNGTGLAGLRAHLKARAHLGGSRNWLLFGERTQDCDLFYANDVRDWLARGVLERCDLAFSRDQPRRVYVQDVLLREQETLRRWIEGGAALFVCGSRDGMSAGVHAALQQVVGAPTVDRLMAEGRYRRDVY